MQNSTILELHQRMKRQHRNLLTLRACANACTSSKVWSIYAHRCKAAKKELKITCEALRVILKLHSLRPDKESSLNMSYDVRFKVAAQLLGIDNLESDERSLTI